MVELGGAHVAECTLHINAGGGDSQQDHGSVEQQSSHTHDHIDQGTGELDVPA